MLALGFGLVTTISIVWAAATLFFGLTSEHHDIDELDDDDDDKALFVDG